MNLQDHSSDLGHFGRNLKDFHAFHSRFQDIAKNTVKHVLSQCKLKATHLPLAATHLSLYMTEAELFLNHLL